MPASSGASRPTRTLGSGMEGGRWRKTCARSPGPILHPQPALELSWVKRSSSSALTDLSPPCPDPPQRLVPIVLQLRQGIVTAKKPSSWVNSSHARLAPMTASRRVLVARQPHRSCYLSRPGWLDEEAALGGSPAGGGARCGRLHQFTGTGPCRSH